MDENITISKHEYKQLLKKEALLDSLEAAGVDNWSGYDEIDRNQLKERKEEIDKI